MAEWLKATDCKSVDASLRWFESTSAHFLRACFGEAGLENEPLWRGDSADEEVTECHVRGEEALP